MAERTRIRKNVEYKYSIKKGGKALQSDRSPHFFINFCNDPPNSFSKAPNFVHAKLGALEKLSGVML